MSIKGFPSQKKLTTKLSNYTDKQSLTTNEFVTAQPTSSDKIALDTVPSGLTRLHPAAKTAEANTDERKRVLLCTAHGASKGDVVRFELASANPYFEAGVLSVPNANTIILATELTNNIVTGDEFYILRHVTQRLNDDGSPPVVITSAPIQYVYDGVDTEVEMDTGTPANSRPLPVWTMDSNGAQVDLNLESTQLNVLTEVTNIQTNTDSLASTVVGDGDPIAGALVQIGGSDGTNARPIRTDASGVVQIKQSVFTSGSVVNGSLGTTVANTEAAPANAIGFYLQNESTNSNPIRFNIGAVASTTNGVLLEAGRSSDFVPIAATVSICNTVSSTQLYSLLWVIA